MNLRIRNIVLAALCLGALRLGWLALMEPPKTPEQIAHQARIVALFNQEAASMRETGAGPPLTESECREIHDANYCRPDVATGPEPRPVYIVPNPD
jgi:hypothetical protein